MPHWLPAIDIAIAGECVDFLREMSEIGMASGRFDVERHFDSPARAGLEVVNFRFREEAPHSGVGFQLMSRPDIPGRVLVEVRASRWKPDPPTRAVYCEAARSLVGPLLTVYNRANSKRYRLRIEKTDRNRFRISPRSTALLERFTLLANKTSLHPLDWTRFYGLVSEGRQEIPEEELRVHLMAKGFSRHSADRLAELYTHLWAFKRYR
jgi:hypothetical protein